jgi:SAM-dependent methyltransferase
MRAILCGMADMMHVFDRRTVRERRDRAAPGFSAFDFLFREVGNRLADRLLDVTRQFPRALDLGCHTGALKAALHDGGKIDDLVQCDLSEAMARQAGGLRLVSDEEALPFAESCFDLILSNLSLHWVNDLPGSFVQVRRCLKPDGFFLAAILGGDTLIELRDSLMAAEIEIRDGVSPRLSPFMQISDAGALLQRAGFALPVIDADKIVVTYDTMFALLADLRAMGETNAATARSRQFTPRALFLRAAELYRERHANADGRIRATFEVIYLHGWAPHESQQQALRPGSAQTRLADVLDADVPDTDVPDADVPGIKETTTPPE